MLDSNTSLRVRISVLGHVVVSEMGIVQVPYATVTVKYFCALMATGIHGYRDTWVHGYRNTWIHGYMDACVLEHIDT